LMVTITPPSDEFNVQQIDKWRQQIIDYMISAYGRAGPSSLSATSSASSSPSNPGNNTPSPKSTASSPNTSQGKNKLCKISEVVKQVREPWPLVWNGSIISILEEDPRNRFVIETNASNNTNYVSLNVDSLQQSPVSSSTSPPPPGLKVLNSEAAQLENSNLNTPSDIDNKNCGFATGDDDGNDSCHVTLKATRNKDKDDYISIQNMYESQKNVVKMATLPENDENNYENIWRMEIYNYIMSHKRSMVPNDLLKFVPKPSQLEDDVNMFEVLESDPWKRFVYSKTSRGLQVVSLRISDKEKESICDEWRCVIYKYLQSVRNVEGDNNSSGVTISVIGKDVPRPWLLGRPLTLQDVLRDDPLKRFRLEGFGEDVKVYVKGADQEQNRSAASASVPKQNTGKSQQGSDGVENSTTVVNRKATVDSDLLEEWCQRTAMHIAWHRHAFVRDDIGDVGVPPELVNTDLISHLKADIKQRFSIFVTSKGMQAVNLNIKSDECQGLINDWRKDIFNFFFLATKQDSNHSVEISKVANFVARPWLLPRSCALYDVLKADPLKSFKISGGAGNGLVHVALHENALKVHKCPLEVGNRTEDAIIRRIIGFNFNDYTFSPASVNKASEKTADEESSDRGELFRRKVSQFLLWHRRREVSLTTLSKHIKSDFHFQQLGLILEKDPQKRFQCSPIQNAALSKPSTSNMASAARSTNNNAHVTKGNDSNSSDKLVSFHISDANKQEMWKKWLDVVACHFEHRSKFNPEYKLSLSKINHSLPNQWFLTNSPQVLQYQLQNDHLARFEISPFGQNERGANGCHYATVRLSKLTIAKSETTTSQSESSESNLSDMATCPLAATWRNQILAFLHDRKKAFTVYDVEVCVPRPPEMANIVSMMKVLQTDPLNRFSIYKNPRSIRYITPTVSDDEMLRLLEEWKFDVLRFLIKKKSASVDVFSASLNSINRFVTRHWLIPKQYSLYNLLDSDVSKRVVLEGGDDPMAPITLAIGMKEQKSMLSISFDDYYVNLNKKSRIPLTFLKITRVVPTTIPSSVNTSANSTASAGASPNGGHGMGDTAKIEKKKSGDSCDDDSSVDSDDQVLEIYMKTALAYIHKNRRGVTQPELDREVMKPKYVIDSFHTLLSDKQSRFIEARNSRNTKVMIVPITKEKTEQLTEEWLGEIFSFIEGEMQKGGVSIYDIARGVIRPWLLPRPTSLSSLLANDKRKRFSVNGTDKNAIVTIASNEKKTSVSISTGGEMTTGQPVTKQPKDSTAEYKDEQRNSNVESKSSNESLVTSTANKDSTYTSYVNKVRDILQQTQQRMNQRELDQQCKPPAGVVNSFEFLLSSQYANECFETIDGTLTMKTSPVEKEKSLEEWKVRVLDLITRMSDEDPWNRVTIGHVRERVTIPWQLHRFNIEDTLRNDLQSRFTLSGKGETARVTKGVNDQVPQAVESEADVNKGAGGSLLSNRQKRSPDSELKSFERHENVSDRRSLPNAQQSNLEFDNEWGSMNKLQAEDDAFYFDEDFTVDDLLRNNEQRETNKAYGGMDSLSGRGGYLTKFSGNHIDVNDLMSGHYNVDDLVNVSAGVAFNRRNGSESSVRRTPGEQEPGPSTSFMQYLSRQKEKGTSLPRALVQNHDSTMNRGASDDDNVANMCGDEQMQYGSEQKLRYMPSNQTTPSKLPNPLNFPSPQSLTNGLDRGVNIMGSFHGIFSSNAALLVPDTPKTPTTAATQPLSMAYLSSEPHQTSLDQVGSCDGYPSDHSSPPMSYGSLNGDQSDSVSRMTSVFSRQSSQSPTELMGNGIRPTRSLSSTTPPRAPTSSPLDSSYLSLSAPHTPRQQTNEPNLSPRTHHSPSQHQVLQTMPPGTPPGLMPPPGLEHISPTSPISPRDMGLPHSSPTSSSHSNPPTPSTGPTPTTSPRRDESITAVVESTEPKRMNWASVALASPRRDESGRDVNTAPNIAEKVEPKRLNWASVVAEGNKVNGGPPVISHVAKTKPVNNSHKRNMYPSTSVHDWLKIVFGGKYDSAYISEMNQRFGMEGLKCCGDMLQADAHNKLTHDFIVSMGYCLEHLEMILISLDWIKEEPRRMT